MPSAVSSQLSVVSSQLSVVFIDPKARRLIIAHQFEKHEQLTTDYWLLTTNN
jgi:hypothetical protein